MSIVASGVFAVVIDKERASGDPFERAWTYLLQRLRIRSTADQRPIMIVHDDGEADRVRTITRAFRRHSFAPNGRSVSAPLLVEDPIPRNSAHSYFVQAADLAAYAAFRRIQPPNRRNGSVCSEEMWNVLEPKWLTEVQARGDGLVLYPR